MHSCHFAVLTQELKRTKFKTKVSFFCEWRRWNSVVSRLLTWLFQDLWSDRMLTDRLIQCRMFDHSQRQQWLADRHVRI